MRCCSFIRLACDPDEGDLPEHDSERGQRHCNRQESARLPEGGIGTSHLTSSLLLEEYRSLARCDAPTHNQAYPKYQLAAPSLVLPDWHSSVASSTDNEIPTVPVLSLDDSRCLCQTDARQPSDVLTYLSHDRGSRTPRSAFIVIHCSSSLGRILAVPQRGEPSLFVVCCRCWRQHWRQAHFQSPWIYGAHVGGVSEAPSSRCSA